MKIDTKKESVPPNNPYSLIRKDGAPDTVIPNNAPWRYRWGYQGLNTIFRYFKKDEALKITNGRKDNEIFIQASTALLAAQFSCWYGRGCSENIRILVDTAIKNKVATKSDLRAVIQYKDLKEIGNIAQVKPNSISTLFTAAQISIITIWMISIVITTILSVTSLTTLIVFSLFHITAGSLIIYLHYYPTIRPFFVIKRIGAKLEKLYLELKEIGEIKVSHQSKL